MSLLSLLFIQAAALAFALVGGVFLAFSDFIMRSLTRVSPEGGAEAMQVINREVFRWVFMALFLGLAPVSVGLVLLGASLPAPWTGPLLAAAGITYLLGCFGVTIARNVPLNERLARMDAREAATQAFWRETYAPRWTRWNTRRGLACVVAAALCLAAVSSGI
ncbi:MAG: anthrone oxygenase family protein [Pseudomonadota bacterium]